VTWFAVVALLRHAQADVRRNAVRMFTIQSRAMPAMAILTLFLLVNEDVWKAAGNLSRDQLVIVLGLLTLVGFMANAASVQEERHALQRALTGGADPSSGPSVSLPPLTIAQRLNVTLAFAMQRLAYAFWVGAGVFLFLVALGATVITDKTAQDWLGGSYPVVPLLHQPVALVTVAVLLSGFATLQFTVASAQDAAYRTDFYGPAADQLTQNLRAHARYTALVGPTRPGLLDRTPIAFKTTRDQFVVNVQARWEDLEHLLRVIRAWMAPPSRRRSSPAPPPDRGGNEADAGPGDPTL
jgi:hypothetical protein